LTWYGTEGIRFPLVRGHIFSIIKESAGPVPEEVSARGGMNLSRLIADIVSFAQSNTVIVIVLTLILLFFIYRKLKLFLILLLLGLFLAGLIYMISSMAGSGWEQKKRLIDRGEKQSWQGLSIRQYAMLELPALPPSELAGKAYAPCEKFRPEGKFPKNSKDGQV